MPDLKNIKIETIQKATVISKEENQDESLFKSPEPLDKNILTGHIEAFANSRKDEHKMVEFAVFHEREFDLEGNTMTFKLDNEMQIGHFGQIKPILLSYLRKIYGHGFVGEAIVETTNQKKMVYSQSDKFKYLAEQYPELEELKKRLGLELEF
jgi:DNA polymerase-3 subunit gamma/tau